MVEYAMILAAIAVVVVAGFRSTGISADHAVAQASRLMVDHHHDNN